MKPSNSNERIKRLLEYYDLTQTEFCKRAKIQKYCEKTGCFPQYLYNQSIPP